MLNQPIRVKGLADEVKVFRGNDVHCEHRYPRKVFGLGMQWARRNDCDSRYRKDQTESSHHQRVLMEIEADYWCYYWQITSLDKSGCSWEFLAKHLCFGCQ